jgi:hypothetical protein
LKSLDITLTPEQIQKIEDATKFEIGFPFKSFVSSSLSLSPEHHQLDTKGTGTTPSFGVSTTTAHTDEVPQRQAIRPSKD